MRPGDEEGRPHDLQSVPGLPVKIEIDLSLPDLQELREIGAAERTPVDALIKYFVTDGIARYRVARAAEAYQLGELDLLTAARESGIGIARFVEVLRADGIDMAQDRAQLVADLRALSAQFGRASRLDLLLNLLDY